MSTKLEQMAERAAAKARERSMRRGELLRFEQRTSTVHAGTMERRTAALFFR